jgi:GNAT superfamily N-acetyltransferase
VRRLAPDDWKIYRDVRLLALTADPAAFGSRLEVERDFDEARWRSRLAGAAMFAAIVGRRAVGLAGGLASQEGGAELVSMWLAPAWRGTGVAAQLIEAVAEWAASSGFGSLDLWVVEGNLRAERAYAKSGFVRTGRAQAVREDEPAMELQMARALGPGAAASQSPR